MKDVDISIGPKLYKILDPITLCKVLAIRQVLVEVYYRDLKNTVEKGLINSGVPSELPDDTLPKLLCLELNKQAFELAVGKYLEELSKEEK